MNIEAISFIEFAVGQSGHTLEMLLLPSGFAPVAAGIEDAGRRCHVFAQNAICVVLSSGGPTDKAYVEKHGEGVRDIAFRVPDVARAFEQAVGRGAKPIREPTEWLVDGRRLVRATVSGIADVVHSFVDGSPAARSPSHTGQLLDIDHIAFSLEAGTLDATVEFYKRTFDFLVSHEEYVETRTGGMRSKVVESANGRIRFPLQEPSASNGRGQIAKYLANHGGAGVQHVAFLTDEIVRAVTALRQGGIEFLDSPRGYYDVLEAGPIEETLAELQSANVLVDRDRWGYLLQIFAKSRHPRQTLFLELIQRRNARGFGSANIRALFQALEQRT